MSGIDTPLYVTMTINREDPQGSGWPVAVYGTQEEAEAAVEKCRRVKAELDRIYNETVLPFPSGTIVSCGIKTEDCIFRSKDGFFYATADAAAFHDRMYDYHHREDLQELFQQQTGEDFVVSIKSMLQQASSENTAHSPNSH